MACSFCQSRLDVLPKGQYQACKACRQVSKRCKKETGLYYNVESKNYVHGDTLRPRNVPEGRAVVFDLHNVADQFDPEDFVKLIRPLVDKYEWVAVLSFVGSTTKTRLDADAQIKKMMYLLPEIKGYLCFARKEAADAGTKGGFIRALNVAECWFYDDSSDHIASATAAGAHATLIHMDRLTARSQLETAVNALTDI
jgi:hypothetical protein